MWIDRLLILILLVSSFAYGQRSRSYILAGQEGDPIDGMSGVVASWREGDLVASTTTNWTDRINSYVAVANGGVTAASDGSGGVQFVYDGINDSHSVDSDPAALDFDPSTDDFSIAFEIGTVHVVGVINYVSKSNSSNIQQYEYRRNNSTQHYVYVGDELNNLSTYTAGANDIFVFTYNATDNDIYIYKNGSTMVSAEPNTGTSTVTDVLSFASTEGGTAGFDNISLKEVVIWDRELSASEANTTVYNTLLNN